jgi:asparagine synthase (glutamine-hydrolysing)
MCGIVGVVDPRRVLRRQELQRVTAEMAARIARRGPDGWGTWEDPAIGVGFAHRRLSIIDLSEHGHQPMHSASERFVITFNGEIYNYEEIRKHLDREGKSSKWRGHSDTEVLIAGFEAWGVENTIQRLVGMFAFAVLDRWQRTLFLVRDRLGEKPLNYGFAGKTLLFASEFRAFGAHPDWHSEVDRSSLALLLRLNYIPAPWSIHANGRKLRAGHMVKIQIDQLPPNCDDIVQVPYWSMADTVRVAQSNPFPGDEAEAVKELDRVLRQSVRGQMLASDVPVGAFLSGGIDSSTVVSLMQAQSSRPVRTYTIGFREKGYNEAENAAAVAAHLGTEHTELYVTAKQARDIIPCLPSVYDEPFSDSSQIPTFLISQLARHSVTVALSGDGGDELFGGYTRYLFGRAVWSRLNRLPSAVVKLSRETMGAVPIPVWNAVFRCTEFLLPQRWRQRNPGDKIHKLADMLATSPTENLYCRLISHWTDAMQVTRAAEDRFQNILPAPFTTFESSIPYMMFHDTCTYLPGDILVKVDRAAMHFSLETRLPFLDHRVLQYAWSLPLDFKVRKHVGKWIVRELLRTYVPPELTDRPKVGFAVPLASWLRNELRDWAESLLSEDRLRQSEFFDPVPIRTKWAEHLSGRRNWQYHLWDVLMFEAWLDDQRSGSAPPVLTTAGQAC